MSLADSRAHTVHIRRKPKLHKGQPKPVLRFFTQNMRHFLLSAVVIKNKLGVICTGKTIEISFPFLLQLLSDWLTFSHNPIMVHTYTGAHRKSQSAFQDSTILCKDTAGFTTLVGQYFYFQIFASNYFRAKCMGLLNPQKYATFLIIKNERSISGNK